jgi:hypothetical protein
VWDPGVELIVRSRLGRHPEVEQLARHQSGVLSRAQLLAGGLSDETIEAGLRARRWRRLHPGVYALFTGPVPEQSRIWSALLWAGSGAVLAGTTALRGFGLERFADERVVEVLVDHTRRVRSVPGVLVRRRADLSRFVHPAKSPPSVRVEDAVLHTAAGRADVGSGLALIADACQARLTEPGRLRTALDQFPRLRRRAVWAAVLTDVAEGAHSYLEVSYLRRVERPHRLPRPDRQRAGTSVGRRVWRDGAYAALGVALELDGRIGHDWASDRGRDRRRDLVLAGRGALTIRIGYDDVVARPCETAALVARVLWSRGWRGRPVACGAACRLETFLAA